MSYSEFENIFFVFKTLPPGHNLWHITPSHSEIVIDFVEKDEDVHVQFIGGRTIPLRNTMVQQFYVAAPVHVYYR